MRPPSSRSVVILAIAAAGVVVSTQARRVPPTSAIEAAPQQDRQASDRRLFRTGVTRVEVSALVLDANEKPVTGLIADDFEVFENGVAQRVRSFVPFTYTPDVLVMPDPVLEHSDQSGPPPSMPASNFYTSASRVFALILDDLHVDARRTQVTRAAARRLVEQLTPADLLLVVTTGSAESTGDFTRDRRRALQMIDHFMGQRLLDQTMAGLRFSGHDFEAERLDHYERMCATIRNVSLALREVSGRRKTVVLLSEGSSFGSGLSDMTVRMPTARGDGAQTFPRVPPES